MCGRFECCSGGAAPGRVSATSAGVCAREGTVLDTAVDSLDLGDRGTNVLIDAKPEKVLCGYEVRCGCLDEDGFVGVLVSGDRGICAPSNDGG